MKTKFLIPVMGVFAIAFAITMSNNSSQSLETSFLESDNVAFAQDCGHKPKHYCVVDNTATYDAEFCGPVEDEGGIK